MKSNVERFTIKDLTRKFGKYFFKNEIEAIHEIKDNYKYGEVIQLAEKYIAYLDGEMDQLLSDKIDDTSYTGFSLINWIASLRNPTEQRLRDAMEDYRQLFKAIGRDLNADIKQINEKLIEKIHDYKESSQVTQDSEKYKLLHDLETALRKKWGKVVTNDTRTTEQILKEVRGKLLSDEYKDRTDLNDVKVIFSKICAVNPDLDHQFPSESFDEDLTYGSKTMIGYIWSCVQWFLGNIQALGKAGDKALDSLAQSLGGPEHKRIDKAILQKRTELSRVDPKSSEDKKLLTSHKNELQEIFVQHELKKVIEGDSNWYDFYSRVYPGEHLDAPACASLFTPAETKKKSLLEKIEQTDPLTPQARMHHLHKMLGQLKHDYSEEYNGQKSTLKQKIDELEKDLRKITFPKNERLDSEKDNQDVFKRIDNTLNDLEKEDSLSSSKSKESKSVFRKHKNNITIEDLRGAVNDLASSTSKDGLQEKLGEQAIKYMSTHYHSQSNKLRFPETMQAEEDSSSSRLSNLLKF